MTERIALDDSGRPPEWGERISFAGRQPGYRITGTVARTVTSADIWLRTDPQSGLPMYWADGRAMLFMLVRLLVAPAAGYPEGKAEWHVSSSDKEDLDIAMQAAGCEPRSVPEAGAVITLTVAAGTRRILASTRQARGLFEISETVKEITYTRP